ncbi:RsmB/NOP family class I SAM-dependent RNA methyltransferase [Ignisphaera sp. 4213-co]|uniref:RsmB/NOP family class I SAM-dependent RNA methyltransferase n=1 Tax=Ignisphaera cupida TaxID=3050454 RepID=A0ABD4Z8B8_9CREN|nr:RsmB/NOP family class I SAM-dependent RNA methyltransferase [Ignisphaera sp. 4213-co]MDK6029177.1 RsmB/NOP family class I SAM-dependent RNA methyltransferase [Ignisphaera sp. 4213-co]
MSYIVITEKDLEALVKAVKLGEEIKPSQQAKRDVFKEYGITGTFKDRILTAIYYDIWKRVGIIDRIASEITNVSNVAILDPWLRASLRVAIEILVFERFIKESRYRDAKNLFITYFKRRIAKMLSDHTHSYVGAYFWDIIDKIASYKWEPRNVMEKWEYKYMVSQTIINKLLNLVGKEETIKILKEFNKVYPISIRVNTLKSSVEEVVEELKKSGIEPQRSEYVSTVLKFKGPYNFDKSNLFKEGKIVIQEEASALASIILNPKPGEVVVDMCAAPGGKTQHIGELMKNNGIIYAFDIDELRIKRMKELLKRTGIEIVKIFKEDARNAPKILGVEVADKILLDAPCSSSGTIMKNPELRWRITEERINELTKLQMELLETAIKLAKKGGRILYTTCSLFREENEDIIQKILNKHHNKVRLVPLNGPFDQGFLPGTMRAWPHKHKTYGFFYALLEVF